MVGKTVTLELKPEQAETLARARQSGTLSLALRSIADVNDGREAATIRVKKRGDNLNVIRYGVASQHDDAEVTERTHDMKCREIQPMMRTFIVRALSFSAVAALTLNPALTPVVASDYRAAGAGHRRRADERAVPFARHRQIDRDRPAAGRSRTCWSPIRRSPTPSSARPSAPISSAPRSARPTSSSSIPTGQQIAAYDIAVKRDLNGVRAALKQSLPNSDIQIEGVGDGVMLSGTAASPIEAQQAADIAARLVGGADKVVNSIAVRGRDQVMLKVTVAEVAAHRSSSRWASISAPT